MSDLPEIRGKYRLDYPLAKSTWFQVGGNAELFVKPEDIEDLSNFLKNKPVDLNVRCLGVCSNLIIRDGGIEGAVVKLGRKFSEIKILEGNVIECGAAALDFNIARFAGDNSLSGLEFLVGIPGTIGGAIAMNAGAYGTEIKDILIKAEAVDKEGNIKIFNNEDFEFSYRNNNLSKDFIFTKAWLKCKQGDREKIKSRLDEISNARETTQPVRSKTGGSTFRNPEGSDKKAWQLIDEAGCRGLRVGGAQVSEKHCNFLINCGGAIAKDLEDLGEIVRKRVFENSGVSLEWEIKRIGKNL